MKKLLALSALLLTTAATTPALADATSDLGTWDKERFQIRVRTLGIFPDGDGNIDGTTTQTDVDQAFTPEIDVSYFFTDHIAAELIAATANHDINAGGGKVGDAWILPPTLTLQYHFQRDKQFSPYVGIGVNYSLFYGEDETGTTFNNIDVDGGFGLAFQAGADYWLDDNWGLNLDVKYVDLQVDVDVNSGSTPLKASDVDLDPWIIGAGVSYRF